MSAKRNLDSALIRQLKMGKWIENRQNIMVTGKTGGGKTILACAFDPPDASLG